MRYIPVVIISALLVAGCGSRGNNQGGGHEGHEGHDHAGHDHGAPAAAKPAEGETHAADEIIFPASQAALTDFRVEAIVPSAFSEVIRTSGQILSAQGDEACLSAPVSGIVTFGAANLTEGGRVGQGQNLFYISSKNVAAGDVAARAQANYRRAKAEYERLGKLLAERIVSQKEYEQAEYGYRLSKAEWDAIAPAASARGIAVAAPMSGYVVGLQVHEGDYVEVGAVLANVARGRRLQLRAEVSQKYYGELRTIRSARIRTPYGDSVLSLSAMNGRLLSVGQATAASGYMIPVTFEFDNPGGVVAGSWVEVWLLGAQREGVLSLPAGAVTEQGGLYYVYVQLDGEGYLRREVKPGASDGERVAIVSGLTAGERVVTRGAVQVRMAAVSGAIPHGHSH